MYRNIRSFLFALLVASCVATACADQETNPADGGLHFNFDIVSDSRVTTRSQISTSDEIIRDVELFLFDSQTQLLVKRLNFTAGSEYRSTDIPKGRKYIVYALANCSTEEDLTRISQMEEISIQFGTLAEIDSRGLPMAGISEEFTFSDSKTSVSIPLKRLMSKIIFNIDTDSMKGKLTVKEVTLHNAPKSILPFGESSKASEKETMAGDSATQEDINRLNSGNGIVLLVGENMQGTLLEGNTDPWKKTPENIPDKKNCCTYITLEGDYCDGGLSISDVCYNMYLGENSTTNFDIRRNCIYDLSLTLSDEATVLASSWKVERGTMVDTREISFDRPADTLLRFANTSRRIVCSPSDFDYDLIAGEGFEEAGLSYVSNPDGTITVNSGAIPGKSATGRLYVRSWDRTKTGHCDFTVMNWDTIVKVNGGKPLLMWQGDTLKFTVDAFFENDNSTQNITSATQWDCVGNAGKVINYGKNPDTLLFVGQKIGTSIISANYRGHTHSIRAAVSTTKSIYIEPRDTTIHVGDSLYLRGHVVFESGDTLCYTNGFDYLVKHLGIFTKNRDNKLFALRRGAESPMAILIRDKAFFDSTSSVITVLP